MTRALSYADAAWYHMDRETNLMVITAVLWFDEAPALGAVKALVRERLIGRYPKFRQRIAEQGVLRGPRWEDDPDFDLDRHVVRTHLPAPGDRTALQTLVGRRMSEPFPPGRPLWRVELVDEADGGAALVCRLHHCIADGISLMKVLLSLTDSGPEAVGEPAVPPVAPPPRRLPQVAADVAATAVRAARQSPVKALRTAGAWGASAARLILLPPDRRTVLKGPLGVEKRAIWTEPVDLDRVKAVARALGATINDVVLTAVSAALGRYLEHRDSLVSDVRAIVPFNLRPLTEPVPVDLGNQFGLVFLSLPVGHATAGARLAEVRRRMRRIKDSPEGPVSYAILSAIGCTPVGAEKLIVDVFGSKVSSIITNVPGPRQPVYMAGRKVAGLVGWVPCSGQIGLGVSIFSYDGRLVVGFAADARRLPDIERLVPWYGEALEELEALSGVTPAPHAAAAGD